MKCKKKVQVVLTLSESDAYWLELVLTKPFLRHNVETPGDRDLRIKMRDAIREALIHGGRG